jgi:protein farnesyltransferase/geranylgeranyltransferase type-1 subunit alpha
LPVRTPQNSSELVGSGWGKDKTGRDVGEYTVELFEARTDRRATLTSLTIASRSFSQKRDRARRGAVDPVTGEPCVVCENEIDEERERRAKMAALRAELYGERTGSYAQDPEWDDIEPIPQNEPEGALAAIAYPEEYAEGKAP